MKYRSEETALVLQWIPKKIASVNYASFARVEIENLQPWARGYEAISHSGRHILGCNFLFEKFTTSMCLKTEHLPQTEHQRQPCRKKLETVSVWKFIIKKTQQTNKKTPHNQKHSQRTTFSPTTFLKCHLTTGLENNCLYGEARDQKSASLVFQRNRLQIHIFQK